MIGNRPADVCALCDRPIDLSVQGGYVSLHLYLGPGWVHGGGREEIPIHVGCAYLGDYPDGSRAWQAAQAALWPAIR